MRTLSLLRPLLLAGCAASALVASNAWSASVRGSQQNGFSRIVFTWPQDVNISARVDGTRLAMTFNRKGDFNFASLKSALPGIVQGAEMTPDGRTVLLTLDRAYRIRTFTGDRMAGVDLLEPRANVTAAGSEAPLPKPIAKTKPKEKPKAEAKKKQAPAKTKQAAKPPAPPKKMAAAAPPPPVPETPASRLSPLTDLAPAAGKSEPAAPPPAPATPASGLSPAAPVASPPDTPPSTLTELAPAAPPRGISSADENDNVLSLMPAIVKDTTVLRFAFAERTACAVFRRAGYLWIVFSRPVGINLDLLQNQLPNQSGNPERLPMASATVLRIPMEGEAGVTVTKDSGSFAWQIGVSGLPQPTTNILKVAINTDPPVKPHLLVGALEVGDPIAIKDPTVGDDLIIIPSHKAGEGIMPAREFIDFTLLESPQGLIVQKIADDTTAIASRNGIRISTRKGAQLTPGLPQPEIPVPADQSAAASLTLFPYDKWKPEKPEEFDRAMRKLFSEMALAKNPQEKNNLRLRLAQLYLGQGMGVETLGMVQEIRRTDPAFYISRKLNALSGAANFLMYRFGDSAQAFAALELNNNEEVLFWRKLTAELLGSDQDHFDYMAMLKYIGQYPPLFRQRLAVVAADRSIAAKEFSTALKILDTVQEPEVLEPIKPYVNFLLGKISASTGQPDAAVEVWKELAENYQNPYVRASAEFSMITQQMQSGGIDGDEAIKRLERLRIAWRGDGLELSVLMLLGTLYDDRQDYGNALNAWRDVVTVFPNTEQANDVNRRMQNAFLTLFNKGEADKMGLLDALALFYEYRDLTPVGEEGDRVVHRLADKLMDVDLLEQAGLLLDQQMRTRQQKEARSRTGAKLALVYLLNHEPEKALQSLELSAYGDNPTDLQQTRDRLAAQAMTETGRYDEALVLLKPDESAEADRLRVQVYWKRKDWPQLITAAEASIKKRDDPAAPVSADEADKLLKLALAYIFEKDDVQLQYLHDYFVPLFAGNPNQGMFDFLTRADVTPDPQNFEEAMQQVDATRSFLESYRTHLKAPEPKAAAVN